MLCKIMATKNTSQSSESLDSEINDIPIVPPQPVTRKEYKELVPDISMISDIVDHGSEPQHFENYPGPQIRSKYSHVQPKFKDDLFSKNNPLLHSSNHFLHRNINNIPIQQQPGINSCVSRAVNETTEGTNAILDHVVMPVTTYLKPDTHFCIINHPAMSNKVYNGQYIIPKNCASILLPVCNELSNKEIRHISEDRVEVISNKACHKHMESNASTCSNHKANSCNHGQLSCSLNSNEPEIPQIADTQEFCCFKDQQKISSKCNRLISLNARLDDSKKSEEINGKEMLDTLKYKNILCPTCFKKPCKCNFTTKDCDANPHAPSIELSSIWEYLKQQDEKINLIHEKVTNFLSRHASCLIEQPIQGKEFSNATESDIPYILNILEVHSDKIKELQDQINVLKSSKPKYANVKIDESILNQAQTKTGLQTESSNEHIHCSYPHNIMCREQQQKITKTSTSTMTSFVIENNDKFVYREEMSLVNDRQKNEPKLPNEHDCPITKKHLSGKNVNSSPQERKSNKLNKSSPSLKCMQNVSSNSSSDEPDFYDNQELKTTHKSSKKSKHASKRNKVSDKKNVNEVAKRDVEGKKNSPTMRTHSKSSKQKTRNGTCPKTVDMTIRDLRSEKMTRQTSTTSSSSGTECYDSEQRIKELDKTGLSYGESAIVSKYGLSSKNLSMATKRYLDNYGLRRTTR